LPGAFSSFAIFLHSAVATFSDSICSSRTFWWKLTLTVLVMFFVRHK
jgi:hypothetical protein